MSSQGDEAVAAAAASWGIDYTARADPELEILSALRKRGLPAPCVNRDMLGYLAGSAMPGGEYAIGMYQPAVLVLRRGFEVVFEWVATPGLDNLGGACLVRPSANRVLRAVSGERVAGSAGSEPFRPPDQTWLSPLLGLLLLANGNFVAPKTMTNDATGVMPLSTKLAPLKLLATAAALAVGAWRHPARTASLVAVYAAYAVLRFGGWARRAAGAKAREEDAPCKS